MKIGIHSRKSDWYKYLKPKRLTLKHNPPIYKWLIWYIALDKKEYSKLKNKKGQNTFVYCPICDNELISSNSIVKDTDYVYYKCKNCGHEGEFYFDAPCPILVKEGYNGRTNK